MAEGEIACALRSTIERLSAATKYRSQDIASLRRHPRLVAVTKTKPKELIIEAYRAGQIHFGENYVQELNEKANDEQLLKECPNIKWHMIGHLQRTHVNKLLKIPNLYLIETIDSERLASAVNIAWHNLKKQCQLKVFIQINTSREENKYGIPPDEAPSLAGFILNTCSYLKFCGVMTIGAFDHDLSKGPNPDFQVLLKCHEAVCQAHSLDPSELEISMGMSHDFEHAIAVGSTNVRVGSSIFGARNYSK